MLGDLDPTEQMQTFSIIILCRSITPAWKGSHLWREDVNIHVVPAHQDNVNKAFLTLWDPVIRVSNFKVTFPGCFVFCHNWAKLSPRVSVSSELLPSLPSPHRRNLHWLISARCIGVVLFESFHLGRSGLSTPTCFPPSTEGAAFNYESEAGLWTMT